MCNKSLRAHEAERISYKEKVNPKEINGPMQKVKPKYITHFTLFYLLLGP